MSEKKMVKKGMKDIQIKEEIHKKLMLMKYSDNKFHNISDVIEYLLQQAKV